MAKVRAAEAAHLRSLIRPSDTGLRFKSGSEFATVPATVAYRLTEGGSDLIPRLEAVLEWAVLDADDTGNGPQDGF